MNDSSASHTAPDHGQPGLLTAIEPQPGQVVSGRVVAHRQGPLGANHLIVTGEGGLRTYHVDPAVRLRPSDAVELRAVILETTASPAWEVYVRPPGMDLRCVPGQHTVPRTETAEQWLEEIKHGVLPDLLAEADRLRDERLTQATDRRAVNPGEQAELLPTTALAGAREEVLGPRYAQVCRAARAAEQRCARADAALRRHRFVGESVSSHRPAMWDWVRQQRKSGRLKRHLQQAQSWRKRMEAERGRLERPILSPATNARIEQRAQELLKSDRACRQQLTALDLQERRLARQVAEAKQLVLHLQRHRGSLVTLERTIVQGRAQTVPSIPGEARLRAIGRAQLARVAPSQETRPGPAMEPETPDQSTTSEAKTPKVRLNWPGRAPRHDQSNSNGIGMKM